MDETKKEPTTAEAFAFCRTVLKKERGSSTPNPHAVELLALLERRMGAMARAADLVLGTGGAGGLSDLRAALTDAPAVFTLEEVKAGMARLGIGEEAEAAALAYLAALRR